MINAVTFGDLAQSFLLQRRSADLRADMTRLNQELVTGQVSDVKSVLAGNVSYLAGIENDLRLLEGYQIAAREAASFAGAMQIALDRVQSAGTGYAQDALIVAQNGPEPVLDQLAVDARTELETIISALNTTVGGRAVFGGTATNRSPIADAATLLTELQTAIAAETSVDDIMLAADAWFASPTGFTDTVYTGSDTPLSPFRLADGETVSVSLTADNAALRNVIKSVALSALADGTTLSLSVDQKRELLHRSATDLLGDQDGLTAARAGIGATQERIDQIQTRTNAQSVSLEFAKGALLNADPYETATKLEEVQFQLQSLYTVTARMSDLSLVNFIR